MREIKFRAWDKKKSDWEDCFFYVAKNGKSVIFDDEFAIDTSGDYILQQFTGLHDKNGKEIYEGDIIRYKFKGTIVFKREVQFKEGAFKLGEYGRCIGEYHASNLEVVGNIFENLEMLKQ